MRLLALDTSLRVASLALLDGDQLFEARIAAEERHEVALASRVRALLTDAGISARQLDAVVVGLGPGSFTGLRIGVAFGTLLARGASCPAIGISGFEAMVAAVPGDGPVMVLQDDHPRGVYCGHYLKEGAEIRSLSPLAHGDFEAQLEGLESGTRLVGSALRGRETLLRERAFEVFEDEGPSASVLLRLGAERLADGTPAPWSLRPLYVQPLSLRRGAVG